MEQLEPELVRPTPIASPSLPHWALAAPTTPLGLCDSSQQVGAEQRGALGGELNTRNSTESPAKEGEPLTDPSPPLAVPMVLVPWAFPWLPSWEEVKSNARHWRECLASAQEGLKPDTGLDGQTHCLASSPRAARSLYSWLALRKGSWGRIPRPALSPIPTWS